MHRVLSRENAIQWWEDVAALDDRLAALEREVTPVPLQELKGLLSEASRLSCLALGLPYDQRVAAWGRFVPISVRVSDILRIFGHSGH